MKRFLKQFLSDPRVVEVPRLPWWLILNGIILPLRSAKTLQAYARVWTPEGSPLLAIATRQQAALQELLGIETRVALAMRYGNPSFESVVAELLDSGIQRLVVLPLYPQNSATTTATTFHHLADCLAGRRDMPSVHFIDSYYRNSAYIAALADSVRNHWQATKQRHHLLMSFHGLPQVNVDRGDPYYDQCLETAAQLAGSLQLEDHDWSIGFQSRFGKQLWLKPYSSDVLSKLAQRGIRAVDVICPGFSADCLETLDEIQNEYREDYIAEGGEQFHYIPALNTDDAHIKMMRDLVQDYLG